MTQQQFLSICSCDIHSEGLLPPEEIMMELLTNPKHLEYFAGNDKHLLEALQKIKDHSFEILMDCRRMQLKEGKKMEDK
jgi:hypothetical protein